MQNIGKYINNREKVYIFRIKKIPKKYGIRFLEKKAQQGDWEAVRVADKIGVISGIRL